MFAWAFLPARHLPGNRTRHLQIRLHLRLHPGKGFAHAFSLWLHWGRLAMLRRAGRIRPALPLRYRLIDPREHSVFLGRAQAHLREVQRHAQAWPEGSYGRQNRQAIAARETRIAARLRAVEHAYQAATDPGISFNPSGPGGTGKTELAKGFARWWRDTGGVDDPRLVLWHSFEPGVASFGLDGVISALGLQVFGAEFARLEVPQRLDQVKRLLAQLRVLLIWDNFESVREMPDPAGATPSLDEAGCTALKEFLDWVQECSFSTVLVTSRAQEEWLGPVRRIGVGGLNRAEAAQYAGHLLTSYPAAQARRERRSFGELLEWLDGHPLAMRLILPRLEDTEPALLLAALRGTTPLPARDDPEAGRNTSLPASITYSYAHLTARTRQLLPVVSLFHGVTYTVALMLFSVTAAVPGRFARVSHEEWTAALADAARVGLLTALGVGFYQIHPALPGYLAAEWHAADPSDYDQERQACEQALCTAMAELSTLLTQQISSGKAAAGYTVVEMQRRTLGAMLGYALDHQAWNDAERIVRALDAYWDTRGLRAEADTWADRILEATTSYGQTSPGPLQSLWLFATTTQTARQVNAGQLGQAEQTYERALTYLQNQPETEWIRTNIAAVYHQLGNIAHRRGQLDDAEDWYRKALAVKEELGDRSAILSDYHQLGMNALARRRMDEAEDWYRKALTIREELGDRLGMAGTYHELGNTAHRRGQLDDAEGWYRKALTIFGELRYRPHMAMTYHQLGMTAQDRGRLDEAEDWYRKALTIDEELRDRPGMAMTYHQLGVTALARRRLDDAEGWYRKALTIFEELRDRPGMALTYTHLGLLAEAQDQVPVALEWTIRSVSLFEEFPNPLTGNGPAALARLSRRLGMPTLQATWRQITGQSVPPTVLDYLTSQHDDEQPGDTP